MSKNTTIRAAGTIPWRKSPDGIEVALVHRPHHNDWSWPKGHLDPGERSPIAAIRETHEETGLNIRLGVPLPTTQYTVNTRPKTVDYWSATITGGTGKLLHEVDEVAWLSIPEALTTLTYERDQIPLLELQRHHHENTLATAPLIFVRHALAVPRKQWRKHDQRRPLSKDGLAQAKTLPPLLQAYNVHRLVSSSSERCATTFHWASKKLTIPIRQTDRLTEEGFAAHPKAARRCVDKLTDWIRKKGLGAALCTHGPLIETLLTCLAHDAPDKDTAHVLLEAAHNGMDKGEAIAIHLAVNASDRHIVAVRRHRV
ncbi:NUDIX hydrolase [Dermatophilus congolensis]|uniref:Pyrimidine (Deoxy)nucleoside triphosphate pyrophosphohydrolase n=1 Tax=Dermatophilus congolensis TaxID=1863 RepID=A0A239VDD4_9MICO|nr:NUDIX hydrolase [Dermatophilus congolensis]MBO3128632.1 NUDIX hydrolase [Dermatophilus congolensis]MBO3132730.1 NUDIX hydrolase [Dermatophilus congolensis]MBO3133108.1 NUDIX hydrolase [Dermatophilus congolensis]MBO3135342.1 NUDIX hydrolase [Dermatophilus congolensis]MBO3137584.1 NUDIX hydrolase [Dermatophilus congolensis]